MPVLDRTVSFFARRVLARFDAASRDPVAAQRAVLRNLIQAAGETCWGRAVGLAEISSPEEFATRVPLMRYEQAATWWHQAFEGQHNVMWPGHVHFFALSSGTTAGNKLLPVTADG